MRVILSRDHFQKSPFSNERAFRFLQSALYISLRLSRCPYHPSCLSLGFSDMDTAYCRQVETYNMMILFDKNNFGLSRRFKAT